MDSAHIVMDSLEDYNSVHCMQRPIDKYVFLRHLQVLNPAEYHRVLLNHAEEMLPFIYTPTVGQACQERHLLLQDGLPEAREELALWVVD